MFISEWMIDTVFNFNWNSFFCINLGFNICGETAAASTPALPLHGDDGGDDGASFYPRHWHVCSKDRQPHRWLLIRSRLSPCCYHGSFLCIQARRAFLCDAAEHGLLSGQQFHEGFPTLGDNSDSVRLDSPKNCCQNLLPCCNQGMLDGDNACYLYCGSWIKKKKFINYIKQGGYAVIIERKNVHDSTLVSIRQVVGEK